MRASLRLSVETVKPLRLMLRWSPLLHVCSLYARVGLLSVLSVTTHTHTAGYPLMSGRHCVPCCKTHTTAHTHTPTFVNTRSLSAICITLYCCFLNDSSFGHIRTTSGPVRIHSWYCCSWRHNTCIDEVHYTCRIPGVEFKNSSDETSIYCQVWYAAITTVCKYQWHVSRVNSNLCLELEHMPEGLVNTDFPCCTKVSIFHSQAVLSV